MIRFIYFYYYYLLIATLFLLRYWGYHFKEHYD